MDDSVRRQICQRAGDCCEYCGLPQAALPFSRFHVDHIVAEQHGGREDLSNLALSCARCNLNKGPNLSGVDHETGKITNLFNPRTDRWNDHFERRGVSIVGLTATGRATVNVLKMNEDRRVKLRASLER